MRLINLFRNAEESIYFSTFNFTLPLKRNLFNNQSVHNKSIMARRTSINETVEAHAKRVAEVNKRFQFNKPMGLFGRKK